jgi:hypothetical protein
MNGPNFFELTGHGRHRRLAISLANTRRLLSSKVLELFLVGGLGETAEALAECMLLLIVFFPVARLAG